MICFAENGFDGTSIRTIADRAQRPLSLLAHYFKNKEGLYTEVFKMIFESTLFNSELYRGPSNGYTPKDKEDALRLLREHVQYLFTDVSHHNHCNDPFHEFGSRLWLQEIRSPRPSLLPIFNTYVRPFTDTIRNCIRTLRPDLEPQAVVILGVSIIGQITSHGLMRGLNQAIWEDFDQAEDHPQTMEWLMDLCLNGLLGGTSHPVAPTVL